MVNVRGVNVYPASIEAVVRPFRRGRGVPLDRVAVGRNAVACGSRLKSAPDAGERPARCRGAWPQQLREALGLTVPVRCRGAGHAAAVRDEGPPIHRGGVGGFMATTGDARSPDVVVIGGGPAGSTVSTLIAQQGYRVAALRARAFPALPHRRVADSGNLLGAQAAQHAAEDAGRATSSRNTACSSSTPQGSNSAPFYFWDNKPHECSQTWQVVRSEFDQMMLNNAREHGVDVHEGVRVHDVLFEGDRAVGVTHQGRGRHVPRRAREGRRGRQRPERPADEPAAACASGIRS